MPLAKFSVKAESKNETKVNVETPGGFKMVVDEPENQGGTNQGANPVEYVLTALAGCLNVVGHLVAKEMGFEIDSLSFEISGKLDPAKFMGKSEKARAGYQEINVKIDLKTEADAETINKWMEVVEKRCPVSDNLVSETPVKIEIK
jgi:uncharacterized OsmC-like protein